MSTVIDIPRGSYVTVDGLPNRAEGRCPSPPGRWLRPIDCTSAPWVLEDATLPLRFVDGSIVVGRPPEEIEEDGLVPLSKASVRDGEVMNARLEVIEAWEMVRRLGGGQQLWQEVIAGLDLPEDFKIGSRSTIYRHRKKYATRSEPEALIPQHARQGNWGPRRPPWVMDCVEDALDAKYGGKGSLPSVRREAISLAKKRVPSDLSRFDVVNPETGEITSDITYHPDGSVDWESLVSRKVVQTALDRRSPRWKTERAIGKAESDLLYRGVEHGPVAREALERVEADNFTLPGLYVFDDRTSMPLGVPWISLLFDCASESVLGISIGFRAPTSATVAECIKHASLPKDLSWTGSWPDGRPVIRGTWPMFGKLRRVVCDQGADFLSNHTRNNAKMLGFKLLPLPPGMPHLKGKVERFIGSVKRGEVAELLEILPWQIAQRGGPKDTRMVLTLDELRLILTYWIVEIHHKSDHHSLGRSPEAAWADLNKRQPVRPPHRPEQLDMLLGRVEIRDALPTGVQVGDLFYQSPGLTALRTRCSQKRDGKVRDVTVKIDPEDIGSVWVFATAVDSGKPVVARAHCTEPEYARGLSLHQHEVIKAHAKAKWGRSDAMPLKIEARLELEAIGREVLGIRKKNGGHADVYRYLSTAVGRATDSETDWSKVQSEELMDLVTRQTDDEAAWPQEAPEAEAPRAPAQPETTTTSASLPTRQQRRASDEKPVGSRILKQAEDSEPDDDSGEIHWGSDDD